MADPVTVEIGPYVAGEKPPSVEVTFTESDRVTVLDLTGFTARWLEKLPDGNTTIQTAIISGPTAGKVTYAWLVPPEQVGNHYAEVWVGNTINRYCSDLYHFKVRSAMGTVPGI